ncbi:hypothetical protein P7C73_g4198, partial [Tremellales sp. Uapishka_1]
MASQSAPQTPSPPRAQRAVLPRSQHPRPNPISQSSPALSSLPGRSSPAPAPPPAHRPTVPHFHSNPIPVTASSSSGSSQPLATPLTGLLPKSRTQPSTASSTTSVNGLLALSMANSTPQTGASRMALAAKRGQERGRADAVDGLPGRDMFKKEEEDHPLSDKSLAARGYQTVHTMGHLFHLPSRWSLLRPLGQGAYGLVISVQDSLSGEPVAVKLITRVFDKVILARRALREITLLRHFGGHENLTGLIDLDHVWPGYHEIYLYMEPMEADLHQIVRSGQPLSNAHIQFFLYQLLRGMKYIHSANVIHRDLKPGNLLVNSDCELKICDFGLARGYRPVTGEEDQNEEMKLTEYVATRWYRAPEVMLSNRRYTSAIDVWSIGCILAELLALIPIFKGKDYVDQLNLILEVLGTPDNETLMRVGSEKACAYLNTLPHHEPIDLGIHIPNADPEAIDLLSKLLIFDPSQRMTVVDALSHPYVSAYHDESDEPSCPELFEKWEEVESLSTIEELREAVTREIEEFRAEVRTVEEEADKEEEEETIDDRDVESLWHSKKLSASPHPDGDTSSSAPADFSVSPRTSHMATVPAPPRKEKDSAPTTPMEDRASRRSSAYMHRRPTSFFSSPMGIGMTPLPSKDANAPHEPMLRSRSRAPSATGMEFATTLRPLLRQLSTVGFENKLGDTDLGLGLGGDRDEPPMTVSPSDAPPSEVSSSLLASDLGEAVLMSEDEQNPKIFEKR